MVGPTPDIRSIDPAEVAVFEVRPGLWNLRIPLVWPGISHVNVAVLAGADGGITLVDCGTAGDPTCWDALLNGLAETGHGIADVTDLVITHAHSDHFGLASTGRGGERLHDVDAPRARGLHRQRARAGADPRRA